MKYHTPQLIYGYLVMQYLRWLGILAGGLAGIIMIFDLIELFRRTATKGISLPDTAYMALLKLPHTFLELFPFLVLMATWVVFFRLMRASELVIMRMSGLSIWHVLAPVLIIVMGLKIVDLTLINPIASSMHRKFEQLESRLIHNREDRIALSENGLWVRQVEPSGQFILHANSLSKEVLSQVSIYEFTHENTLVCRFDAKEAIFTTGSLSLTDVSCAYPDGRKESFDQYTFFSELTYAQIQENSASPDTISFWRLPEFIRLLDQLQLSSMKYRLYWHSLIAQIFFTMSMVLMGAAGIYFQLGRRRTFPVLAITLGMGFAMFFVKDVTQALGLAGTLPILMAAWIPVAISWLVGCSLVLYCEDM
jgi:lipopolysaccharide export system permease protein